MLRRILLSIAALVAIAGIAIGGGLWWLGTESGLRLVVERLQDSLSTGDNRLRVSGASGSLYSGVRMERFEWQSGDGLQASGTGLVARWSLSPLLQRHVLVPELAADTITVQLPPPAPDPAPREALPMPGSFALPVTAELQRFAVGELRLIPHGATDPIVITGIGARLDYREGVFTLAQVGAQTPYGRLADLHATFGAAPPHRLTLRLGWAGEVEQIPFELEVSADGDLDRLAARTTGKAAGAALQLDAKLAPLAVMPLMSTQAKVTGLDLRRLVATAPQTALDANLQVAPEPGTTGWSGALSMSNADSGVLSDGKLPLLKLDTRLAISDPDKPLDRKLQLRDLQLTLRGPAATTANAANADKGRIAGSIVVWPGRLLSVAGVEIPEVQSDLTFSTIDIAQFGGQLPTTALDGTLKLARSNFALSLAQSEERVRKLMPRDFAGAAGAAEVSVRGRIDKFALRLDEARLRLGQTRLNASGEAGLSAPYRIALKGEAQRIELAQWLPRNAPIDARWRDASISGAWSIDGKAVPGLDATLSLRLADSTLAGKTLGAEIQSQLVLGQDWMPVRLDKTAADIRLGRNRVRATGALGRPSDKLSLDISVAEPELFDPRLQGQLSLDGELEGAFDRLRARVTMKGDRLSLALPDGPVRVGSVRIDVKGPAAAAVPPQAPLDLSIQLRSVQAAGRQLQALDLKANGTLAAHRFDLSVSGEGQSVKLNGDGRATLDDAPSWRARLAATTVDGPVPIRLTGPADIRLDAGSVRVERFNVAVAGGEAKLERLTVDWGGTLTFDTRGAAQDLPITRLLALAGTDPGLDALKGLRLDASWNLKGSGPDDLSGEAKVDLREVPGEGQLQLSGDNGVQVSIRRGQLKGQFDLDLPSLAFTHPLTAPDLVLDGRLRLEGSVSGTLVRPLWNATLTGKDLALLQRSVGWRLTDGVLAARFEGRKVQLQTLKLGAGEGSVELRGEASLLDAPRAGTSARTASKARKGAAAGDGPSTLPIDGRFELTASKFQVPIGPGQRVALSGTTTLSSGADGLALRGKLRVDQGIIEIQGSSAPALPDDVKLVYADAVSGGGSSAGGGGLEDSTPVTPKGKSKDGKEKGAIRILSDLAVDLGDRLRVTGNGIAARLTGSLNVLGTLPEDPRLTGVINIVDGSYEAYGQNLRIEKGTVRFNGPIDNPTLDLVAKRPFLPVEVGVSITGTALNPKIALVSTPDMSETDKLSWLVLGTDPTNAPSAAESLALRQAAQTLLLKDDGSYKPGIAERLGLDVVNFGYGSNTGPAQGVTESRNPTGLPGGQSGSASAAQQEVVTLGKRIGSKLFISYEQGVRGLYNLLRIQYSLSQRLSVRAQSGSDNAVDLMYSFSFD